VLFNADRFSIVKTKAAENGASLSAEIRPKPRLIVRPIVRPRLVDLMISLSISTGWMKIWSE
jgi:hypothetical protein